MNGRHGCETGLTKYVMRWHHILSEFITPEGSADEPVFNYVIRDNVATITRFVLPPHMRGRGEGTRLYREWESRLPETVTRIILWAKNPKAVRFWLSVGFEIENEDEGGANMQKLLGNQG